jgi:hypothetical protein
MIKIYLKENKMDGLVNESQECACLLLDDDFMTCHQLYDYPGPYGDCESGRVAEQGEGLVASAKI